MGTKTYIYIGIFIGGSIGGWVGSMLDGGSFLSIWSILLSGVGSLAGIWVSYKLING